MEESRSKAASNSSRQATTAEHNKCDNLVNVLPLQTPFGATSTRNTVTATTQKTPSSHLTHY